MWGRLRVGKDLTESALSVGGGSRIGISSVLVGCECYVAMLGEVMH